MNFLAPVCVFLWLPAFGQSWQQQPAFAGAGRDDGSAFVIGDRVYCGLGNAAGVGATNDFYCFDAAAGVWSSAAVASLPALGRQYACSFAEGGYGFIAGGVDFNWNATNEVWRYDTLANSWQQMSPMPDSLQGASCFFINGKAYLCGGRKQANACVGDVWEYDVANDSWSQKNDMPDGGRWRASAAVINSRGYLIFGADSGGAFSNKLFEYDAVVDHWTLIDSFPGQGRTYAACGAVNDFFVVGLGADAAGNVYNDFYLYDVSAQQWIAQGALPSFGRKGCMSFTHNGNFYFTTGMDGSLSRLTETWKAGNLNAIEIFNPPAEIRLWPNPAGDFLSLEAAFDLKVLTAAGAEVLALKNAKEIDVRQLPAGIYFLKIEGPSGTRHQKFLVER